MPSGARPGERRGGRAVGVKNKTTLEKERVAAEIAARTMGDARRDGKKLAKEVLEEFMFLFAGMAAQYQPIPPGHVAPPGRTPNEPKFLECAKLAVECAHKLAPYQSPTFRAIVIAPPPEDTGKDRERFTLTIFEGGKAKAVEIIPPSRKTG